MHKIVLNRLLLCYVPLLRTKTEYIMNDLPVTGYPCYAQRTLGWPGGKHCKSLEGNVSQKIFSTSKQFWGEINAFSPLVCRKWIWPMLIHGKCKFPFEKP